MSLFNPILSLFGVSRPHFGKFDPDDITTFVKASEAIEDAEREDDAEGLASLLAKYGVKDTDDLSEIEGFMAQRHRLNPEYTYAKSLISHEESIRQCATSDHPIPEDHLTPVEGVPLHTFGTLHATYEAEGAGGLARYNVDEAGYQRISAEWHRRMSSTEGTFTANILKGSYHTFYLMGQAWVANGHALFGV